MRARRNSEKGTAYIGAAFGTHNIYKVDYDYDGVGSMTATATILATLTTAADALIVPGGNLVVAGQGPRSLGRWTLGRCPGGYVDPVFWLRSAAMRQA